MESLGLLIHSKFCTTNSAWSQLFKLIQCWFRISRKFEIFYNFLNFEIFSKSRKYIFIETAHRGCPLFIQCIELVLRKYGGVDKYIYNLRLFPKWQTFKSPYVINNIMWLLMKSKFKIYMDQDKSIQNCIKTPKI